ncbi:MAG: aldehyde dehydrogenase family protein [Nitrososphaerota archaeon]
MSRDIYVANLYINGSIVEPSTGKYQDRYDPGDNSHLIGKVADGSKDVGAALDAARETFDRNKGSWVTDYRLRARALLRVAEIMRSRAEELAWLESLFVGKTIRTSRLGDIPRAVDMFEYYAGIADKVMGHSQILRTGDVSMIVRQPIGVVAAITPWNFPLLILARQVAPALAVGCTVVAKPASYTPTTAFELAKIMGEAGVPPGVFNLVMGRGEEIGSQVLKSDKVDVVNFTGETNTGKWIQQMAAGSLKRVVLELGGKNPNIVFEDADLETAANGVVYGAFANNGESCAAGSRLLVHRSVKDRFVKMVSERVSRIRVGYQLREDSDLGPLVSQGQLEKVLEYVGAAESEGLRVLVGGRRLRDGEYARGNYVQPTLIDDTPISSKLFREEIFGPAMTLNPVATTEEGIRRAADSRYGLQGGLFTNDLRIALRALENWDVGGLMINDVPIYRMDNMPFGGWRQSGLGREGTRFAMEEMTDVKFLVINYS